MSTQDLEQRARELLGQPYHEEISGLVKGARLFEEQEEWVPFDEALRAIVAALRQQPAPVDLEQLNKAYAQGWIAAAEWSAEQHLISDIDSGAYTSERDNRLLSIIDNAGKVAHQPAPVVDDARMARALEWLRNVVALGFPVTSPGHLPAIEEAIAAYDPNCGARTVRVVDDAMVDAAIAAQDAHWADDSNYPARAPRSAKGDAELHDKLARGAMRDAIGAVLERLGLIGAHIDASVARMEADARAQGVQS